MILNLAFPYLTQLREHFRASLKNGDMRGYCAESSSWSKAPGHLNVIF